jgi:hypothetical protein
MWVEPRKKRELRESLKEMIDNQAIVNRELLKPQIDMRGAIPKDVAKEDTTTAAPPEIVDSDKWKDQDFAELEKTLKSRPFLSGLTTGTLLTIILGLISH